MSRFGLDVSSVLQFECCSRVLSKVAVRFGAIFLLASMAALTNGVPCAIAQNYIFDRGDFRVGNSPSAVIAADFNGDGRLDLAVTNESDNTVSILLGIPGGTFAAQTTYPAGSSPTGLVAGDFDGDGKLDLAVMDSCGSCTVSPNLVTILLGNGDGSFRAQGTYATGGGPIGIVAADFNADGKLDLAIANEVDNTVTILLGNGDGSFKAQTTISVGARPYSLASGDFNNDSKTDLVTLNISDGTVSVLLSNGDGTFNRVDSSSGVGSGPSLNILTVGDFNQDGKLDVVVEGSQLYLLLGKGDGSFPTASPIPSSIGSAISFVMAGDFNQDGKLDLAEQGIEGIVMVLLGNGDGTFQQPVLSPLGETTSATQYTTADLNGDGALDFVAVDTNLDTVDVFLGNRDGTFGVARTVSLATDPYFPDAGVVADFNGDGYPDLAVAETNFPNGQISVELGHSDGTFGTPVVSPLAIQAINNGNLMLVGDFNGDGRPDLVITEDYHAGFEVLLGNGDGTFQTPVNTAVSQMGVFYVGDVNGDGKTDIVAAYANGTGAAVRAYLSNGDGSFKAGAIYTVTSLNAISLADVNLDGILDLVLTSFAGPIQVLLGKGDGTFDSPISGPTTYASGGMVLQDFNGDGKPDIAVGTYAGIALLAGNGDGTFQAPVYSACGSTTCSGSVTAALGYSGRMIVGDFNGDGNLDLATYPPFDTTLSGAVVIIGNGDGTFQAPIPFAASGTPDDLLAGDFNSDGISDLAIPNQAVYGSSGSVVTLYLSGPTLDFFPASLTFGMQNVGTASDAQQVKLTNQGPGKLIFSGIQNSSDFSETNNCSTGLGKTQSCSISVIFQPTANGQRAGNVSVRDDAVASPQFVTLVGTGVTRKAGFSPSPLSFPNQFVASTATQTITLTNIGNAPLTTSEVTVTGPDAGDFSQTNTCQSTLPVQGTCVVTVAFTPSAAGSRTGTVVVTDDALGSPQSVAISGTGIDFGLAVSSGGSASQTVAAGTTATYNLVIGGAGFGGTATITCSGAPKGATCSAPANATLNATSTSPLTISITTTSRTSEALAFRYTEFWPTAMFGLIAVLFLQMGPRSSRLLKCSASLLFLVLATSCGGTGGLVNQQNPNGTPVGQYKLIVSATAGSYTRSLPLTLKVQ